MATSDSAPPPSGYDASAIGHAQDEGRREAADDSALPSRAKDAPEDTGGEYSAYSACDHTVPANLTLATAESLLLHYERLPAMIEQTRKHLFWMEKEAEGLEEKIKGVKMQKLSLLMKEIEREIR